MGSGVVGQDVVIDMRNRGGGNNLPKARAAPLRMHDDRFGHLGQSPVERKGKRLGQVRRLQSFGQRRFSLPARLSTVTGFQLIEVDVHPTAFISQVKEEELKSEIMKNDDARMLAHALIDTRDNADRF